MDSDKLALLEEKIMHLIEQNDQSKKEQERFGRELEKRDKRIGELDRTLKKTPKGSQIGQRQAGQNYRETGGIHLKDPVNRGCFGLPRTTLRS